MSKPMKVRSDWLSLVREEIVDPDRKIVDTHHHLWRDDGAFPYALDDFLADTGSGHRVEKTIFMECRASYLPDGPKHLRSLGEVEFIAEAAERNRNDARATSVIAGLVSHIDLTLGDAAEEIVHLHQESSRGLFRGVRHAGARAEPGAKLMLSGNAPEGLFGMDAFRAGVKMLGRLGYCYESWHYHYQIPDFIALARAVPDTPMVLNHFGSPLLSGIYSDRRAEIFEQWKEDIRELSRCENVTAKLGGLGLSVGGPRWMRQDLPPTSDDFVEAQRPYYLHTIECFGPERCMFESNFPVDKLVIGYPVLWNGFKKLVQDFSEDEKDAMFSGTASRVYRL